MDFTKLSLFKLRELRPCQAEIITAALQNKDILVFLPTGHGKSLTYQYPAICADSGCTLVVSPLLALMDDQVQKLSNLGLPAVCLTSNTPAEERKARLKALRAGNVSFKLLYVSPELCCTSTFQSLIHQLVENRMLNRVVIDEAHCVVEWGRQFRQEYAKLCYFKEKYPTIPLTAVTGTASQEMQRAIQRSLKLNGTAQPAIFKAVTNRPNIHYEVRYIESANERLEDLICFLEQYRSRLSSVHGRKTTSSGYRGCGLIYCRKRATTEMVAKILSDQGISAQAYHAKLDPAVKERIMNRWIAGDSKYSLVVATVAFGMGIDKADVRFVVHLELPESIEAFVQQSGRSGRDNRASLSIVYYSRQDRELNLRLVGQEGDSRLLESTRALVKYCENIETCRHLRIARYFDGPDISSSGDLCDFACDICKNKRLVQRQFDDWIAEFE